MAGIIIIFNICNSITHTSHNFCANLSVAIFLVLAQKMTYPFLIPPAKFLLAHLFFQPKRQLPVNITPDVFESLKKRR